MQGARKVVFASLLAGVVALGSIGPGSKQAAAIDPVLLGLIVGGGYAIFHTATGVGVGPARDGVVFGRSVNQNAFHAPLRVVRQRPQQVVVQQAPPQQQFIQAAPPQQQFIQAAPPQQQFFAPQQQYMQQGQAHSHPMQMSHGMRPHTHAPMQGGGRY